ncbi:MAG: tRNA (uridine(34)/cytosine(34)/5-carboxymethylaminomethyluridine(34)-2'-O)-methyltransferase TrmL [Betaproteobacteria bacterium]|nr:tRNA (uridine(34)/cytosine(34)/5-carboxymethylaminomethyluridine(34)-2'-O)-methyltransferase TrmL [Betaproteobacteria bacterium]
MFDVVLFEPEIPPNTGNAIRLCANTGARLHLVEPLGFRMGEKEVRRAGLDYHEMTSVTVHPSLAACLAGFAGRRVLAFSSKATGNVFATEFSSTDVLLFGPETRGLPAAVIDGIPESRRLRLPMVPGNRSLNLSNAVAVVVFEAWRQLGFPGAA